ncbi:unnamed protein product [Protopolystoma xenopodis]|uniref:Uncharacterized protein n=1 Tax=Protopolystoma xenopodis TaxID=117903 RepID=A0A3S5BN46_9PLAT|nr:unnamed protein product [Protopolystoma xenopodis]
MAQLLEMLPRLRPRSYSLINMPDDFLVPDNRSDSFSNMKIDRRLQQLSIVFTRVDFPPIPSVPLETLALTSTITGLECFSFRRYPYRRHGVCTSWLERIWRTYNLSKTLDTVQKPPVFIYLRKNLNNFRLPDLVTPGAPQTGLAPPLVLVGPGSGIAPFIGFLRQYTKYFAITDYITSF